MAKQQFRLVESLDFESLESRRVLHASVTLFQSFDLDVSADKSIRAAAELDGKVLFAASEEFGDVGLWKTDGTREGTDLIRVERSAGTQWQPYELISANDSVFFFSQNENGHELWVTDGTASGTRFLAEHSDVNPLAYTSETLGNQLFYQARTEEAGWEMWVSNGTEDGTHILIDLNPGADSGVEFELLNPRRSISVIDGSVYFQAHSENQTGIWRTDGTEEGTSLVLDANGVYAGERLFHWSNERSQLHEVDSSTGESSVIYQSPGKRSQLHAETVGTESSGVFFVVKEIQRHYIYDELFFSAAGEAPISLGKYDPLHISDLTTVGETLYFHVDGALWTSDGSAAGTKRHTPDINDVQRIDAIGDSVYITQVADNETVTIRVDGEVVTVIDASPNIENSQTVIFGEHNSIPLGWTGSATGLYSFDATSNRPKKLHDLLSGPAESSFANTLSPIDQGFIYGTASVPGVWPDGLLWSTDGTRNGSGRIASFAAIEPISAGGKAYFNTGNTLHVSDGSASGTLVVEAPDGTTFADIGYRDKIEFNGELYFIGREGFWKTDGTVGGTTRISDVKSLRQFSAGMTTDGESLYFVVDDSNGPQLWQSDGTANGTERIVDLSGLVYDDHVEISVSGNRFLIVSKNYGGEFSSMVVATTDGTTEGTIELGRHSGYETRFNGTVIGGNVVYSKNGRVWSSRDGTDNGSQRLIDRQLTFIEYLNGPGFELVATENGLWSTDGTRNGTRKLADGDFIPQYRFSASKERIPESSVVEDSVVFATASNGVWRTDGTAQGTMKLTSLLGQNVIAVDRDIYFQSVTEFQGPGIYQIHDEPIRQPGDSNGDGVFDSADFVVVFQRAEYEDSIDGNSSFAEGDWNLDGDFNSTDFVFAFRQGSFMRAANLADDVFSALDADRQLLAAKKDAAFLA